MNYEFTTKYPPRYLTPTCTMQRSIKKARQCFAKKLSQKIFHKSCFTLLPKTYESQVALSYNNKHITNPLQM